MEAALFSETFLSHHITALSHNPGEHDIYLYCWETLGLRISWFRISRW